MDTEVGRWSEALTGPSQPVFRSTSLMTQLQAVRSGWGIGMTTVFVAEMDDTIERVLPDVERQLGVWLVTHPGLRRSARIRAVYDFLVERFELDRQMLAGQG